jgi:UDP-glucose 4-epimerase
VNESVENPLRYYDHNVLGTVNLCKTMKKHGCKSMVFSSSCTVYGNPQVCGCGDACNAILTAAWGHVNGGRRYRQAGVSQLPSPRQPLLTAFPPPNPMPAFPFFSPCLHLVPRPSEQYVPIDEAHPLKAVSPYGATKLMIEDILRDVSASDPEWRIILLRYFNPVGAHPSGGCRLLAGC